jgi:NAD-dependent deacetylase sirtuin 7
VRQRIRSLLKREAPLSAEDQAFLKQHEAQTSEERAAIDKCREKKCRDEERRAEVEDSDAELKRKVSELAKLIKGSKRVVVYTGAGMSTAAQIPDYRGPQVGTRARPRPSMCVDVRAHAVSARWPEAERPQEVLPAEQPAAR